MKAYYNEIDPFCAEWLRNLVAEGLVARGDVDERDIRDVVPSDLDGYTQCHFFAGLGGWSHALRLAGWDDERPVWTGSCPCQPFSAAGRKDGFDDERHLWPAWYWLIAQCRPAIVFGEQVASRDGLGWLDLVSTDLEASGYAVGAADLCAAGYYAPHTRQRLWFVGLADTEVCGERAFDRQSLAGVRSTFSAGGHGISGGLEHSDSGGLPQRRQAAEAARHGSSAVAAGGVDRSGAPDGFRRDADWLFCTDGKWRPVEPGTFPLAHGVPARMGKLRAYGNAIVPQVAAEFVRAASEAVDI